MSQWGEFSSLDTTVYNGDTLGSASFGYRKYECELGG